MPAAKRQLKQPGPTAEQRAAAALARSLPVTADPLPPSLCRPALEEARKDFRTVVAKMLADEGPYLPRALAIVREEDPLQYLRVVSDLAEYATPKLSRVEGAVDPMLGKVVVEIVSVQVAALPRPQAALTSPVIEDARPASPRPTTVEVDIP